MKYFALVVGVLLGACHSEEEWNATLAKCIAEGRCGDAGTSATGGGNGGGVGGGVVAQGGGVGGGVVAQGGGVGGGSAPGGGVGGVAMLVVEPSEIDFGTYPVDAGATRTLVVRNRGTARSNSLTVNAPDASVYFTTSADLCTGVALEPDTSCSVAVSFYANNAVDAAEQLVINGGETVFVVPLKFTTIGAVFLLDPPYFDFGARSYESLPNVGLLLPATLKNVGLTPARFINYSGLSGVFGSGSGCPDLAAGASCIMNASLARNVNMMPTPSGSYESVFQVRSDTASLDAGVIATVYRQGPLDAGASFWDAGTVNVGSSSSRLVTLSKTIPSNVGPVTLSTVAPPFSISESTCDNTVIISFCTFKLNFAPTSRGYSSGFVLINTPDAGSTAVNFSGVGAP